MNETIFLDINTRFLIITGIFAIIVLLIYIAFYKKSTRSPKK